jgi:fumarate reductase flavoprotein subunit
MKKRIFTLAAAVLAMAALAGACASSGAGAVSWNQEADVVIIGSGAAGLTAAVEAADQGAKRVIILEKMGIIGGTSFVAQGLVAGYDTQITRAMGETFTREDMYNLVNANAGYKLDMATLGITVRDSGKAIDWLIDRMKVPFMDQSMVGYGPYKMMHVMGDGTGAAVMKDPFTRVLEEKGVTVLLNTKAQKLIQDAGGTVIGVEALADGKILNFKAKAVIIATGGYAYNPGLIALMDPLYKYVEKAGLSLATGDGLIMGVSAGAAVSNPRALMLQYMDYDFLTNHNGNSTTANDIPFTRNPAVIYLNPEGKRFMNEKDMGYMNQRLGENMLPEMNKYESPFIWAVIDQQAFTDGKVVNRTNRNLTYLQADTAEQLAAIMNVPPAALAETIRTYNTMAQSGADRDFARPANTMRPLSGKLYALQIVPTVSITYGGLIHNEKAEVLRLDGGIIPGLYCAGEVSSNSAWMGFTLSSCFVWGRLAGQSAAAYSAR